VAAVASPRRATLASHFILSPALHRHAPRNAGKQSPQAVEGMRFSMLLRSRKLLLLRQGHPRAFRCVLEFCGHVRNSTFALVVEERSRCLKEGCLGAMELDQSRAIGSTYSTNICPIIPGKLSLTGTEKSIDSLPRAELLRIARQHYVASARSSWPACRRRHEKSCAPCAIPRSDSRTARRLVSFPCTTPSAQAAHPLASAVTPAQLQMALGAVFSRPRKSRRLRCGCSTPFLGIHKLPCLFQSSRGTPLPIRVHNSRAL